MSFYLRDHREPRDWRVWREPPGWFGPGCCCGGGIGYVCGGEFGSHFTRTDKVDFAAETTAALTTADITTARSGMATVANPGIASYFLGGNEDITPRVVTADKLTFSSETTAAVTTADLPTATSYTRGLSERSTKGYIAGGNTTGSAPTETLNTYLLTFSSEVTSAVTTANLTAAKSHHASVTNGSTAGYWLGGLTNGARTAAADKTTFASDATVAMTSANLSVARYDSQTCSNGSTFGYVLGGFTTALTGVVDRITFATDVTAARTSMSLTRMSGAGMSSGTEAIIGGLTGPSSNTLSKLVFSTEAITSLGIPANLSISRNHYGMACTVGL